MKHEIEESQELNTHIPSNLEGLSGFHHLQDRRGNGVAAGVGTDRLLGASRGHAGVGSCHESHN